MDRVVTFEEAVEKFGKRLRTDDFRMVTEAGEDADAIFVEAEGVYLEFTGRTQQAELLSKIREHNMRAAQRKSAIKEK